MMSRISVQRPEPYFERPGLEDAPRLLLVSWHFPPSQAAGALRWQKLSRFVAERGWGLDVVALAPESIENPDAARLEELASGVRAFGVPAPEPWPDRLENALWRAFRATRRHARPAVDERAVSEREGEPGAASVRPGRSRLTSLPHDDVRWALHRPRSWARAWWAWREHARGAAWAREAARVGGALAGGSPPRAVITCGPPHMVHEAGRLISRRFGIPYVMDLRDPWRLQQRLMEPVASPLWYRLARRHEARCVEEAELVVCNTEPFRDVMRRTYPEACERIIAVMNGFDEEPLPASPSTGPFVLAYAGTIYLDRDPRPLFQAVARVVGSLHLAPDDLRIELVGNVDDYGGVPLKQMAGQEGIGAHVRTGPFRPRREVLELMARATMLVSLPQDSDMAVPSKVFEYMRFPAWLLAMAEPGSATGRVVREAGGDVVPPHDVATMADVIRARYTEHVERGRPSPLAEGGGRRFSRRSQAEVLLRRIAPPDGHRPVAT